MNLNDFMQSHFLVIYMNPGFSSKHKNLCRKHFQKEKIGLSLSFKIFLSLKPDSSYLSKRKKGMKIGNTEFFRDFLVYKIFLFNFSLKILQLWIKHRRLGE